MPKARVGPERRKLRITSAFFSLLPEPAGKILTQSGRPDAGGGRVERTPRVGRGFFCVPRVVLIADH